MSELGESLEESLRRLEPLIAGAAPRELFVEHGDWSAYFDSSLAGTDAVSTIGFLARQQRCYGVAVRRKATAISFEYLGPDQTDFLNYIRVIAAQQDDSGRWVFIANGEVQPFEDPALYRQRKVRDRFSMETLERYCGALGIFPSEISAYGPRAYLIESQVPIPSGARRLTFREAQERFT